MKKILALFVVLISIMSSSMAANIEVQPTMASKTVAQDRVWVGSFQLVWNDFINRILFNPVRFSDGSPEIVHELNKQEFTSEDISDKDYYKTICRVTKNTKKQIARAIRRKFGETSDLLSSLDLTPSNDKVLIYAMLKKEFEFKKTFEKLGTSNFGKKQKAEYFGIDKKCDDYTDAGIKVLFYNNPTDFALEIATKGNDVLYIYKNSSNKPFNYIYEEIGKKSKMYRGDRNFTVDDRLKIPNLKIFEEKEFTEISGHRIKGTNMIIDKAIETVAFDMNNKGGKLKSEAAMTIAKISLEHNEKRCFYVNDTFVIFLKENNKKNPYFALRVNDISKFQK